MAIIGERTLEQLHENLGAIEINLTSTQKDRLNKVYGSRKLSPNWMLERQNQDRDFVKLS